MLIRFFFKFGNYLNAGVINIHLKQLPSTTDIHIDIGINRLEKHQVIESDLHTFSQVRRLYVHQTDRCNNGFYSQVMEKFPNLQKADVILKKKR